MFQLIFRVHVQRLGFCDLYVCRNIFILRRTTLILYFYHYTEPNVRFLGMSMEVFQPGNQLDYMSREVYVIFDPALRKKDIFWVYIMQVYVYIFLFHCCCCFVLSVSSSSCFSSIPTSTFTSAFSFFSYLIIFFPCMSSHKTF